jgi:hypothetical protein
MAVSNGNYAALCTRVSSCSCYWARPGSSRSRHGAVAPRCAVSHQRTPRDDGCAAAGGREQPSFPDTTPALDEMTSNKIKGVGGCLVYI